MANVDYVMRDRRAAEDLPALERQEKLSWPQKRLSGNEENYSDQVLEGLKKKLQDQIAQEEKSSGQIAGRDATLSQDEEASLRCLADHSPYLWRICSEDPVYFQRIWREKPHILIEEIFQATREAATENLVQGKKVFRQQKKRLALLLALYDISGLWSLSEITWYWSHFADLASQAALSIVLQDMQEKGRLDLVDPRQPLQDCGIFLLALGKWGGEELNYSSDIDPILFYDPAMIAVSDPDRRQKTANRIGQNWIDIMEDITADGYVFRTDFRLRPDPGATPLAVSTALADNYYTAMAKGWERAAFIKARFVAGDEKLGQEFLRYLQPFIWRRSLDFWWLDEIHAMKRQIQTHHRTEQDSAAGLNIKLATGGIRDIEFFVQAQQLLFGGRDPEIRSRNTLETIRKLENSGRIAPESAAILRDNYTILRGLEHRLQMMHDQQTHSLPQAPEEFKRFSSFCGFWDQQELIRSICQARDAVRLVYRSLFTQDDLHSDSEFNLVLEGVDLHEETRSALIAYGFSAPDEAAALLKIWLSGRYRSCRSERAQRILRQILPNILTRIGQTPDPHQTLVMLDRFWQNLPSGIQIFSLLQNNAHLRDLLVDIFGLAPELARYLLSYPEQLDAAVLDPLFYQRLPSLPELEQQIERVLSDDLTGDVFFPTLARWVQDHRFQIGVHLLRNLSPLEACQNVLSHTADLAIRHVVQYIYREFRQKYGGSADCPLAIFAMGKLGSREMALSSDLDLVFLYKPELLPSAGEHSIRLSPGTYCNRLAQRIISALTLITPEGPLYEVDLRLRPHGDSAPLAVAFSHFLKYYQNDAWLWEYLALIRGRIICAPPGFRQDIHQAYADILCQKRDPKRVIRDMGEMRQKIASQYPDDDPWDVKYCKGGLVEIDFIWQSLVLGFVHEVPEILSHSAHFALEKLAERQIIDQKTYAILQGARQLALKIQIMQHLTGLKPQDSIKMNPALRELFKQSLQNESSAMASQKTEEDFDRFMAEIFAQFAHAHNCYKQLLHDHQAEG